jgi:hypothetical protein
MNEPQPPIKEYRVKAIKGAIWEDKRTEGDRTTVRHSVRVRKWYKDKQTGEWKETDYFFAEDLPALQLVAQKCYEFVALHESEEGSDLPVVAR